MTDFTEFETVLAAAKNDLDRLKKESKNTQEKIDVINQSKYDKVFNYFSELASIARRNNLSSNCLFIPTTIKCIDKSYYVLRLSGEFDIKSELIYPTIGLHYSYKLDDYHNNSIRSSEQYGWLRWISLLPSYEDTIRLIKSTDGSYLLDSLKTIIDNFDELEPELSANFKEAVTREMAYKLDIAELDCRARQEVLRMKEEQ